MKELPADATLALEHIREIGGDELVHSLLATFLTYADEQLVKAVAASNGIDIGEIGRVAHSVKSSARQLGATALADVCEAAEVAATGEHDARAAIAGVEAMQRELADARRWMEAMIPR